MRWFPPFPCWTSFSVCLGWYERGYNSAICTSCGGKWSWAGLLLGLGGSDVDPVARMESFRALKVKTLWENFLTLILSWLESFRALNLSRLENFLTLKFKTLKENFRALKLSCFEIFRALKLSILVRSFNERKNQSEHTCRGFVMFIYSRVVHGCSLGRFRAD